MGSFDVTCCVTKTPIISGERCHLVILNGGYHVIQLLWDNSIRIEFDLWKVFSGKYADYGRIENVDFEFSNNSEKNKPKNFGFYISDDAWKLGTKLQTHKLFKYHVKRLDDQLTVKMIRLTDDSGSPKNLDHIKIVSVLNLFCKLNNFNMFDPSFVNTYAGQSFCVDEKEMFNKLRTQRVNKLKKIEASYE